MLCMTKIKRRKFHNQKGVWSFNLDNTPNFFHTTTTQQKPYSSCYLTTLVHQTPYKEPFLQVGNMK